MATQQSLLEEYECELNSDRRECGNLSHLSQCEQVGEWVPHQEIQQALKREKKNASRLVALENFNKELLSCSQRTALAIGYTCSA